MKTDHCEQKPPANARYQYTRYVFVMGTAVSTDIPSVKNTVKRWYIDSGISLPAGLSLDEVTGAIAGVPESVQDLKTFTVYAENESGAVAATVSIQVRKGQCKAEGVFPLTYVDETAVYECASQGSYVGTQKRTCVLGAEDGEWQKASGVCIPIIGIIIVVILVIVIIVIIVFILVRVGKKTRIRGGVKGKKNQVSTMSTSTIITKEVRI